MAVLFSTIKDLRTDALENHDSRALPAPSRWKKRLARPAFIGAGAFARQVRLATDTGGSVLHGGRIGWEGIMRGLAARPRRSPDLREPTRAARSRPGARARLV